MAVARRARFQYIGIGQDSMRTVAEATRVSVLRRIQSGLTVNDAPARPLKSGYAKMKNNYTRKHGSPAAKQVRNWTLSGHTLRQMRIMFASATQAVIGFLDSIGPNRSISAGRIVSILNRMERQFGMSDANRRDMHAALAEEMKQRPPVRATKERW